MTETFEPTKKQGGWLIRDSIVLPECNRLTALLVSFRTADEPVEKSWLFWEIATIFWSKTGLIEENEFTSGLILDCCRNSRVDVGVGNMDTYPHLAAWAIVSWLSSPSNTIILLASPSMKEGRKATYLFIRNLLASVPNPPCRIKDSLGSINYCDGGHTWSHSGMWIVPTEGDFTDRLLGIKAQNLMLISDSEGPLLDHLVQVNLSKNPKFQEIRVVNS